MTPEDAWSVLNLDDDASQDAVERAYERLSALYDPDRHRDDSDEVQAETARRLVELTEAYETLQAHFDDEGDDDEGDGDDVPASRGRATRGSGAAVAASRRTTPAGGEATRTWTTRRIVIAAVAALVVAAIAIGSFAAFRSSSSDSATTATTDGSTPSTVVKTSSLDDVTVSTDLTTKPTVTFDPSFAGDGDAVKVVVPGTGPTVTQGQLVTFDFVSISGVDGSETQTNWGSTQPSPSVLLSSNQILPVVSQALVGQPVGSRVIAATDQAGQTTGVWTLFVFDIKAAVTPLDGPQGTPVTPPSGLPTVTVTDGKPTITMPTTTAPTSLVVQPLIKGDGAVVQAGQTVVVNYVGAKYADGTVFDSSFNRGSPVDFQIGVNQVIPGWDEGIVGQTVGSRVLLVIPPDKGYGTSGNSSAGISGTDTLVFVVDILAAG